MSTPTTRRDAKEPLAPVTPTKTSRILSASPSVEPRSEYLRNALDAKRARQSIFTPPPSDTKRTELKPDHERDSDPWMDQAKVEEEATKTTPTCRIRPGDGPPRMLSQRGQHVEADKMKEVLFSLNLKLELVRKQNNELKDKMDEANRRIEELQDLEDENHDLRACKIHAEFKLQDMAEEIVELRQRNRDILQIQDESVANMEMQNTALEEAAEIIINLEKDKDALAAENAMLKEQANKLQPKPVESCQSGLDGHDKHPSRVYSIDESHPSTSNFDSDYYSQPGSPNKESMPASMSFSDRARFLLSLNKESKKSTQDLKKRFSDASMKNMRPSSVVPEVPRISEALRMQKTLQVCEVCELRPETPVAVRMPSVRTSRRSKPSPQLSPALLRSNSRSTSRTPKTPTDDLRGIFNGNRTLSSSSSGSRPSLSYAKSPLESKILKHSPNLDQLPAMEKSNAEHLSLSPHASSSDNPLNSEMNKPQINPAEWDNYCPPDSVGPELKTESDADYRARWSHTVGKLASIPTNSGFVHSSAVTAAAAAATEALGSRGREVHSPLHTQAQLLPRHLLPPNNLVSPDLPSGDMGRNFLFNPSEDDEGFLRRISLGRKKASKGGER